MNAILNDIKYAIRTLSKRPAFGLVVILTALLGPLYRLQPFKKIPPALVNMDAVLCSDCSDKGDP